MSFAKQTARKLLSLLNKESDLKKLLSDASSDVFVKNNIDYSGLGIKYNLLDIIYPQKIKAEEKLPCVVYIHGNEALNENKQSVQNICFNIANGGCVVFNINYRDINRFDYPAQITDVIRACKWVYDNSGEYFADNKKMFLAGNGFGAFLASVAATFFTNENVCTACSMTSPVAKDSIIGLLMLCGTYPFAKRANSIRSISDVEPIGHITSDYPTSFIFANKADFGYKYNCEFVNELKKVGIGYNEKIFSEKSARTLLGTKDKQTAEELIKSAVDFILSVSN